MVRRHPAGRTVVLVRVKPLLRCRDVEGLSTCTIKLDAFETKISSLIAMFDYLISMRTGCRSLVGLLLSMGGLGMRSDTRRLLVRYGILLGQMYTNLLLDYL